MAGTKVVQITKIAPQETKNQMQSLFGHIAKIGKTRLYPTIWVVSCRVPDLLRQATAWPLTEHGLYRPCVDRGLIPDEYKALETAANGTLAPRLHNIDGPTKLPPEVVNRIDGMVPNQVVKTIDPKLDENYLPEYLPLPVKFDAKKIEETRRTLLALDVKSDLRLEDLIDHFKVAGEVKYIQFADND